MLWAVEMLFFSSTAHRRGDVNERRLVEEDVWDSARFCDYVKKHAKVGKKYLSCDNYNQFNKAYDVIHITFINLEGTPGGAAAMNNRYQISVEGFDRSLGLPPPKGKVKCQTMTRASWAFGDLKLRGKSGNPDAIAKYIADFISELAKTEPRT